MFKKKRSAKTIPRQYELFVKELENNAAFRDANLTNIVDKKLVAKLNACGGPQRAPAAWKRILVDWKNHIKRKDKILKTKSRVKGARKGKLSDLEVRLLRIMSGRNNLTQPTAPKQLQDSIAIGDNDHIEFVNEEGAVISDTPKLDFTCNGTPKVGLSHQEEMLNELRDMKSVLEKQLKELRVQNDINKLRTRIEYEKAKAKYVNFNLDIQF